MLEASQHGENAFVTLTYSNDQLPEGATLVPSDLQKYLKRLRKAVEPVRFRFFACGEYGDDTQRPHYHLILFGLPTCTRGVSRWNREGTRCCLVCELHRQTWGKGNVYLGQVSSQSSAYTCGYVVKKWSIEWSEDDPRVREFARMSNRPGIGAGFMDEVASSLMMHRLEDAEDDVPVYLRHGKTTWPLGKYLRRRLRTRIGKGPNAPQVVLEKLKEEMRPVYESASLDALPGFKQEAFRQRLIDMGKPLRTRIDAKERRLRKKGSI